MKFSFLSLFNASISASWLVLVVIGLRCLLKKAPKSIHCALWALVAVRLLCPVSIESTFSLMPSPQTVSQEYVMENAAHSSIQTVIHVVENPLYPENLNMVLDTAVTQGSVRDIPWNVIWSIGVGIMALYALASWLRLRHQVAASIPVARNIRLSDHIPSPFILGIFRPVIYLPSDMDQCAIDHVLAHERAHLARRDYWWKPLGFSLLALHWFNPLLWVAYILLCRDIELACDEKVIKDLDAAQKKCYSSALLACSVSRPMIAACPLAFGEVGVKERVKNVLNYKKPAFWFVALAVVLCIAAAVCFLTDPIAPDAWDVMYQNGYTIQGQQDVTFDIVIRKNAIPEDAFSEAGHHFKENEYIVYQSDNSTVWLMNVQYANEGQDKMYFEFNISHDISNYGALVLPRRVEVGTQVTSGCFRPTDRILYDGDRAFENAVSLRSHGPDDRFTVYIDTEAVRAAEQELRFEVTMNLLVYKKGKAILPEAPTDDFELADGTYVQQEKVCWATHSSLYCYDMEMEVQGNALMLRFNNGEWKEGPLTFEGKWQAECPIGNRYREMLAELADIEPAFVMEDLNDCSFLEIDPSHFLVRKNGELYVVSWMRSNIGLEIIHYIFHVVPEGEATGHGVVVIPETDSPAEALIRQTILNFNPIDFPDPYYASVSYYPVTHALGDGPGGSSEQIYAAARIGLFRETNTGLEEFNSRNFMFVIAIDTAVESSPRVSSYWQSDLHSLGDLSREITIPVVNINDAGKYEEILSAACREQVEAYRQRCTVTIDLGTATLDADPVGDAIRQTILTRNPVEAHPGRITTLSYAPMQHVIGCGDTGGFETIYMMVRMVTYEKNGFFLRELDSKNFEAAISVQTFTDAAPEVTAYWQAGVDSEEALRERFGSFPSDTAEMTGTSMMELELECVRLAALQSQTDADALLTHMTETRPEYFRFAASNGIEVYWQATADGLNCLVTEGSGQVRTAEELDALPPLSSLEVLMILRQYPVAEVNFINRNTFVPRTDPVDEAIRQEILARNVTDASLMTLETVSDSCQTRPDGTQLCSRELLIGLGSQQILEGRTLVLYCYDDVRIDYTIAPDGTVEITGYTQVKSNKADEVGELIAGFANHPADYHIHPSGQVTGEANP